MRNMGYKKDYKDIKEHVEYLKRRYDFNGPLHFTDFKNLNYILREGYLYSRKDCQSRNLIFVDGANHSVLNSAGDFIQSCVRFYYRGKTPTLYDNEGIKLRKYCNGIHIPIPVYLRFDEELLYLDSTEFTNGNATNSLRGNTADFFKNMDWDAIFHDTWFEFVERDYIVNKRQAELLSREPVSLNYLKEIIFRSETDKKRAINIFGYDNRYTVDIKLFSDKNVREARMDWQKNNFIKNYSMNFEYGKNGEKTALVLQVEYQKPWNNYDTEVKIKDKHDNIIENFKQEIIYKNHLGIISNKSMDFSEIIIFKLKGDIRKWYKIELEVNGVLSIEEFLIKYDIANYKIYFNNNKKMVLNLKFLNYNFLNYKHRYEIFDNRNNLECKNIIKFDINSNGLTWSITFNNYNVNWYKLNYFMDDVLCISDIIYS